MQHLTYDEVVAAARRAYDDGTLLALRKEQGTYDGRCVYRPVGEGSDGRCAVGAALHEHVLTQIHDNGLDGSAADSLGGLVTFDDVTRVREFQRDHDEWLQRNEVQPYRDRFLRAIGVEL